MHVLPVEIVPIDGSTLVLRARGSELLILPHHVSQLKGCKTPKDFTGYFMDEALLNRPARKLFEAWLRKDNSLWQRIYRCIQNEMTVTEAAPSAPAAPTTPAKVAVDKPAVKAKEQTKSEKKPAAKAEKVKAAAPAKKDKKEKATTKPKKAEAAKKKAPAKKAKKKG